MFQQLESMRSITQESKVMELQLEKDKCFSHEGEKLSVFCVSCQMCICHLCALFVGQVRPSRKSRTSSPNNTSFPCQIWWISLNFSWAVIYDNILLDSFSPNFDDRISFYSNIWIPIAAGPLMMNCKSCDIPFLLDYISWPPPWLFLMTYQAPSASGYTPTNDPLLIDLSCLK